MTDEEEFLFWCGCETVDECDGDSRVTGRKCKWKSTHNDRVPFLKIVDEEDQE